MLKSRSELEAAGHSEALEALDASVEEEIADAIRFAEESPEPSADLLEATTYKGAFAR
jgi:pyruvate dehydrogenase E1 component alpha subunit